MNNILIFNIFLKYLYFSSNFLSNKFVKHCMLWSFDHGVKTPLTQTELKVVADIFLIRLGIYKIFHSPKTYIGVYSLFWGTPSLIYIPLFQFQLKSALIVACEHKPFLINVG